jgi:hypothetical protein
MLWLWRAGRPGPYKAYLSRADSVALQALGVPHDVLRRATSSPIASGRRLVVVGRRTSDPGRCKQPNNIERLMNRRKCSAPSQPQYDKVGLPHRATIRTADIVIRRRAELDRRAQRP